MNFNRFAVSENHNGSADSDNFRTTENPEENKFLRDAQQSKNEITNLLPQNVGISYKDLQSKIQNDIRNKNINFQRNTAVIRHSNRTETTNTL